MVVGERVVDVPVVRRSPRLSCKGRLAVVLSAGGALAECLPPLCRNGTSMLSHSLVEPPVIKDGRSSQSRVRDTQTGREQGLPWGTAPALGLRPSRSPTQRQTEGGVMRCERCVMGVLCVIVSPSVSRCAASSRAPRSYESIARLKAAVDDLAI